MTLALIPTITALARAGAGVRAWALFREAGLETNPDPAARALHGRLLKDRALALIGAARREAAAAAAAAYAQAAAARPASYPLINAATLALVAGDAAGAAAQARSVLARLDAGADDDTPYWQGATRAEALLLAGDADGAAAALAAAIAHAPRAWEDHAVTIKQLTLICAEQGSAAGWLDALRPPAVLHFTGALDLGGDESALAADIDAHIAAHRIGSGIGALAAGADILVAERLLAAGADVHLVLPGSVEGFVAQSVAPWGAEARFHAVMDRASSLRLAGDDAAHAESIRLADQIAMGMVVAQARQLASPARQLVIGAGSQASASAAAWAALGHGQQIIGSGLPPGPALPASPDACRLATVLALALAPPAATLADALALTGRSLPPPDPALEIAPRQAHAEGWLLFLADPAAAAAMAGRLRAALAASGPLRLAVDHGLVVLAPAGGAFGPVVQAAARLLGAVPDGGMLATDDFAAALAALPACGASTQLAGEAPLHPGQPATPVHGVQL
ncbi:MAG: TRAFs-binding domain-containing protein [Sphingomonadales bacterium]|jgi:hypothetical protein